MVLVVEFGVEDLEFGLGLAAAGVDVVHVVVLGQLVLLLLHLLLLGLAAPLAPQFGLDLPLLGLVLLEPGDAVGEGVVLVLLGCLVVLVLLRVLPFLLVPLELFVVAVDFLPFPLGVRPPMPLRHAAFVFRHKSYRLYVQLISRI